MTKHPNESASTWRVVLATELARYYRQRENVAMIVLGGSPSKGLADAYSDIDMVVYWNNIDAAWLDTKPLLAAGAEFKFMLKDGDGGMELYYLGDLIVEVGHITIKEWAAVVNEVMVKHELNPPVQKMIGGFLAARPIHGRELYRTWRDRLAVYPEPLAAKMVKQNLGFFWKGCIQNQGLQRGDILFFYDGICGTLKRLLGILAGLNRIYYAPGEPRWIEYELSRMPLQPPDTWNRIRAILEGDRSEAVSRLETLIDDVIGLVRHHLPEVDLARVDQMAELEIRACRDIPPFQPLP